jgi:bla regulator protein BlaR1
LDYGNCDISEWDGSGMNSLLTLNGFWLDSSLEILPKEQVDIIAKIFEGKTDFSKKNIKIL